MISGGSGEQLADARDDPLAVQLDGGHELVVGQAGHDFTPFTFQSLVYLDGYVTISVR
jgi:hypothetical protein